MPACQFSRWGAWAKVLGDCDQDRFVPVSAGLLHGWVQTPLRSEITDAISACCFSLRAQVPCVLWLDDQLVFDRIQLFHARPCWFKPNQSNAGRSCTF